MGKTLGNPAAVAAFWFCVAGAIWFGWRWFTAWAGWREPKKRNPKH